MIKKRQALSDGIIFRYMGRGEAVMLADGKTLTNTTNHALKRGTATTARGFCFGIGDSRTALREFRRLYGIVSPDRLLVGKPKATLHLNACRGRYVDYRKVDAAGGIDAFPSGKAPRKHFDELCVEEYSLDSFEWVMLMTVSGYDGRDNMAVIGDIIDERHI